MSTNTGAYWAILGTLPGAYATLGTVSATNIDAIARFTSGDYTADDGRILARFTDPNNTYLLGFASPNNMPELTIYKIQAGTTTRLAGVAFNATNTNAYWERIRVTTSGTAAVLSVKAWQSGISRNHKLRN